MQGSGCNGGRLIIHDQCSVGRHLIEKRGARPGILNLCRTGLELAVGLFRQRDCLCVATCGEHLVAYACPSSFIA